jgi:hypothetical protein
MAITKAETQIVWSAANNLSVSAGSTGTSDAFTFDATSFNATITLKADNNGTPASGDKVDFYLLYTNGDPDGTSSDEYDSATQGTWLATLDTNTNDPAQTTVSVNPSAKGGKIYAKNNAGSNGITVSATMYETKG